MNKTRRRKKSVVPVSKPQGSAKTPVTRVTSPSKIRHGKELIQQHCERAGHETREAERLSKLGRYGEAAVKLREASNYLHLANAEARRLPADAL